MKKFLDRFRNIRLKDIVNKENLFVIIIALAIFWSPLYIPGILGWVLNNNWLIGLATGYLAFWILPGSPAIILQIALIYFFRRILTWMKTKHLNKKR